MDESNEDRLYSLLSEVYSRESDSAGVLTTKELYVLLGLSRMGPSALHTIAAALTLAPAETGILLARLHARALLAKATSRHDQRSSLFSLTAEGDRQLKEALAGYMTYLTPPGSKQMISTDSGQSYEQHFYQQYLHSEAIVCSLTPVFDDEQEIVDLEYRCGNAMFMALLPASPSLRRYTLLSRILYENFDTTLIAASTVWKTEKTITMTVHTLFPFTTCTVRFFKDSPDSIIVAVQPEGTAVTTFLQSVFSHQSSFCQKPIRLAVDCQTGMILGANKTAARFFGSSEQELRKRNIRDICMSSPETITALLHSTQNDDLVFHLLSLTARNSIQKVTMHVHPLLCNNARILFVLITRNFTPPENIGTETEKKATHALCLFEARYNTAIQGIAAVLAYIEKQSITCSYSPGEHFCEYSSLLPTFAFIIEGVFRIYYVSDEGEETTLEFMRPGAVIDSRVLTETFAESEIRYEAVVPGKVLVINQEAFMKRAAGDPHCFELLYFILKDRMANMNRRGLTLMGANAKERYEHFLKYNDDIAAKLRSRDIASYLGITPETLSRIKNTD